MNTVNSAKKKNNPTMSEIQYKIGQQDSRVYNVDELEFSVLGSITGF